LPSDLTTKVSDTIRLANFGVERLRLPGASGAARVIGMIPNQIVTDDLTLDVTARDGYLVADPERDILKVAVVERYGRGQAGVSLLHGLGLRAGAMASSVAHDAHNIVVAGTNDEDMALAVREVERMQGGLVVTRDGGVVESLALPIGGLVSSLPATDVAKAEERLEASVRALGVRQPGAFIFLSFLALSVVPKLKITDRGLLDVAAWRITPVQA
jgi:adenine deaminase